jgi:hypothetical protein
MKQIEPLSEQELQVLAAFIIGGASQSAASVHNASHLLHKIEAAKEIEPPANDPE